MNQRKYFFDSLYELMRKDENIVLITADLGYFFADRIKEELPNQYYNVGAAEQAALTIAVGMALSGKIPVVYSITPFIIFRPFEVIRNYLDHENIPVILVGGGRGEDYLHLGFSHFATDHEILKQFKNIQFIVPENEFNLSEIIYSAKPTYLNLKR